MSSIKNMFKNIFNQDKEKSGKKNLVSLPMPPTNELDKKFDEFLETISMPVQTINQMKLMSNQNKWLMICQYEKKTKHESPEEWVKILSVPRNESTLAKFRVVITGADIKWMQAFTQKKGLQNLVENNLNKAQTNESIMVTCLRAVRAFMNSDFGLKTIIKSPEIFEYFVSPLRSQNEDALELIFDLFTIVSWISVEGHAITLDILRNNRSELKLKTAYSPIVSVLGKKSYNNNLKISAMTFINAIINSIDSLEERNHHRAFILDENILNIINETRSELNSKQDESSILLSNQFDIFEREYVNDQKEASLLDTNLGDPDSLWNLLSKTTKESGQSAYLVDLMKFLLLIPNIRRLGNFIWKNCHHALIIATSFVINDREINEMEENIENIDKNIDLNKIIQTSFIKEARLLKYSEIERIMKKRVELNQKAKEEDMRYENLRKEFHDYKMQKETDIDGLKKQVEAGGAAAPSEAKPESLATMAPMTSGEGVIPAPPMFGAVAAPPPLSEVAAPPPLSGVMAPPPIGGVLAPPPLGGIGFPPPMGLGSAKKTYLPAKPNPAPNVKMKNLHWGILTENNIEGTVWDHIKDDGISINVVEFENTFSAKAPLVKKADEEVKPRKVIKEKVQLIDPKRSTNVEIALSRIKMTPVQIRDSILEMDEKTLNSDIIQKLLTLVPTSEEAEVCSSYDGSQDDLGVTEKFFCIMSTMDKIGPRLDTFLFKIQFDDKYNEIMKDISVVHKSITELDKNENLKKILAVILKIGNHMNGGTKKGGVYGFKLSTLKQLNGTKSIDNKISLLQYIVNYVSKEYPNCDNFVEELSILEVAGKIEFQNLQSKINKMKSDINKTNSLIKSSSDSANDRFKSVMEDFYNTAANKAAKMHEEMAKITSEAEDLIEKYGEDKKKMMWEEIFRIFYDFVKSYKDGIEYWKKQKEQEERDKKKMAFAKINKDKMFQMKLQHNTVKSEEGGISDNVLKNLKETHSDALSMEILKRRKLTTQ